MSFEDLVLRMSRWQVKQFPKATTLSALAHIRKEVEELTDKPDDPEEWADMFHLVVQGGVKASGSAQSFMTHIRKKLNKNIYKRTWPTEPDEDNVYLHNK